MDHLISILITLIIVAPISWLWVRAIDNHMKNNPDYKGEDFLNWDGKHDGWDDNKSHTEGGF